MYAARRISRAVDELAQRGADFRVGILNITIGKEQLHGLFVRPAAAKHPWRRAEAGHCLEAFLHRSPSTISAQNRAKDGVRCAGQARCRHKYPAFRNWLAELAPEFFLSPRKDIGFGIKCSSQDDDSDRLGIGGTGVSHP